ncbi:MAG TPA: SOS response-associated peptidase [Candidatus Acidoferrales bacterium]|nr:SOS response-associated peptidase [Candidatus Acidoferrales bacterium]
MCGRFTITRRDGNSLAAELGVDADSFADYKPRYNVAPTQMHFVMRIKFENRQVVPARWGLVNSWAKDASMAARFINARSESVETRAAFREAFEKRRCVVPADGFFEWIGPKTARRPIWFHREDGGLLLFAGLYEAWQKLPGEWEKTFTILTTAANPVMAPYHDRMPVIIADRDADDWMDPRAPNAIALKRLLVPAPADLLITTPVSPKLNNANNDAPELLESADA